MRVKRLALAHLLVTTLLAVPPTARAESAPPQCQVATVTPRSDEIPPSTRRFAVTIDGYAFDLGRIRIARIEADGARTPVPAHLDEATLSRRTVELVLDAPLVSGARYVLEHRVCPASGIGPLETEYVVGPEVSDPHAAGTIEVSPVYAANDRPGTRHRYHFVRVSFTPDASLAPWSSAASTALWVDGPEHTYRRVGADAAHWDLRIACLSSTGEIGQGDHVFGGEVDVLGLDALPIPDVEATIACEGAVRVDPATLRELTPEEQTYWDSELDGGHGVMDAGVAGSLDAGGDPDAPHEPPRAGGCSVSHRRASGPATAWLLVGIALLALRRARAFARHW